MGVRVGVRVGMRMAVSVCVRCVFVGGGVDEGWGVRVEGVGGCDQERT